jgi:hypothetical protein
MFLLHAHEGGASGVTEIMTEVFWHGILDTLDLIPLLFITYLFMEYIEHKAKSKAEDVIRSSGALAPIVGGLAGSLPQCGFSAVAANLYSGGLVSLGTLVAVFLATSDEMIPILISGKISALSIAVILCYKTAVAIVTGFIIDLILRRHKAESKREADEHHREHSHCHEGIFKSAAIHTAKITLFILFVNFIINALILVLGEDAIGSFIYGVPVVGHLVAAIFGLIPNCAASVALTTLATEGIITGGTMMAGLFSGAGIGLAVLLRENRPKRVNAMIIGILVLIGTVFGYLADLIFPNLLLL